MANEEAGNARVRELFDQLISEASKFQNENISFYGEIGIAVPSKSTDRFALCVIRGSHVQPLAQVVVPSGIPIGRYLMGIFMIPNRTGPIIVNIDG